MKSLLPIARRCLEAAGFQFIDKVEQWIPRANVRKDLFGFIDLLAMRDTTIYLPPGGGLISQIPSVLLGVQVTSLGHISDRVKKILDLPASAVFRHFGLLEVWGVGKKKDGLWLRRVDPYKTENWTDFYRPDKLEDYVHDPHPADPIALVRTVEQFALSRSRKVRLPTATAAGA